MNPYPEYPEHQLVRVRQLPAPPGGEMGYTGSFTGGFPGGTPYGGGFFGGGSPQLPAGQGGGFFGAPPAAGGGSFFGGAGAGAGAAGGGSSFNFAQLKTIVDRMGGIDGVIGTITKVQKVMSSFQQMAPMFKLLMGSFGKKAAVKQRPRRPGPAANRGPRRNASQGRKSPSSRGRRPSRPR